MVIGTRAQAAVICLRRQQTELTAAAMLVGDELICGGQCIAISKTRCDRIIDKQAVMGFRCTAKMGYHHKTTSAFSTSSLTRQTTQKPPFVGTGGCAVAEISSFENRTAGRVIHTVRNNVTHLVRLPLCE